MPELVFRVLSLVSASAYMTVRSIYERRLGRGSKAGQFAAMPVRDRITLLAVGVGSVPMWVYMLSPWIDFAAMGLPVPVRLLGLVPAVGAVAVLVSAHAALGGNWSPSVGQPPAGGLVTGGPYRFVRHPMYLSFLLYVIGIWLLTSNWLAGAPAAAAFAWLYLERVDREERVMLDEFGPAYAEYAARTGRLVPWIGRRRLAGERLDPPAPVTR